MKNARGSEHLLNPEGNPQISTARTMNWNSLSPCKCHAQKSIFLLPRVLPEYFISTAVEGSSYALFFRYKEAFGIWGVAQIIF